MNKKLRKRYLPNANDLAVLVFWLLLVYLAYKAEPTLVVDMGNKVGEGITFLGW